MSDPSEPEYARNLHESKVDDLDEQWQTVFQQAESGLRAFLRGRLGQASDVDDCLQVVVVKMIERGQNVAPNARRAWLFRVAANESAGLWRRKASTEKMIERYGAGEASQTDPSETVLNSETTQQLHQAVHRLPDSWQRVVRLRIYENLTFQQISDQLGIPLGTALTQMRRALERLKSDLQSEDK